jgi:hypothetical protein
MVLTFVYLSGKINPSTTKENEGLHKGTQREDQINENI